MTCLCGVNGRYLKVYLKHSTSIGARVRINSRKRIRGRYRENRSEGQRLHFLLRFEIELWSEGYGFVAGVDEAGMAPLAGPVVAGAVILPQNYKLRGLNDSKKILDPEKRDELAQQIKQDAVCWSVGIAEVEEIDKINIYHAGLLAMQRAVQGLTSQPDFILVDARRIPNCQTPQRGIIRGDALSASIAAASIIAKTTRDAHMLRDGPDLFRLRTRDAQGLSNTRALPRAQRLSARSRFIAAASRACERRSASIRSSPSSSQLKKRSRVLRSLSVD